MMTTDTKNQFGIFLNILDAIPVSIYWKDVHGKYLGCNKYMLDMTGLTKKGLIGKTDYDLVWKDIAPELQQIDSLVIKNRAKYEVEETPLIAGSRKRTYLSTKTPLYEEGGDKIIGMIGISIDVTDRKNAETLRKEKEVANQISRAIEMLSGSIAHEVRTPLAGIGINIDNLNKKLKDLFKDCNRIELKKEIDGFIKNIKFAINNANNIVSMLLIKLRSVLGRQTNDITNPEESKIVPSIKENINSAIAEYPFYTEERKLVVWDEKKGKDFQYTGDPLLTKHVLFNLIKNSLKAIKEAGKGKIYINLHSDENFNYLTIKDTASGIPPNIFDSLFRQFSSGNKEGTGLGLVFCKMTMQSYGGDVTCDSKEGEYTEFTLSFHVVKKQL